MLGIVIGRSLVLVSNLKRCGCFSVWFRKMQNLLSDIWLLLKQCLFCFCGGTTSSWLWYVFVSSVAVLNSVCSLKQGGVRPQQNVSYWHFCGAQTRRGFRWQETRGWFNIWLDFFLAKGRQIYIYIISTWIIIGSCVIPMCFHGIFCF